MQQAAHLVARDNITQLTESLREESLDWRAKGGGERVGIYANYRCMRCRYLARASQWAWEAEMAAAWHLSFLRLRTGATLQTSLCVHLGVQQVVAVCGLCLQVCTANARVALLALAFRKLLGLHLHAAAAALQRAVRLTRAGHETQ